MGPRFYAPTASSTELVKECYWSTFFLQKGAVTHFIIQIVLRIIMLASALYESYFLWTYADLGYIVPTKNIIFCVLLWLFSIWFVIRFALQARFAARKEAKRIGKLSDPRDAVIEYSFYEEHFLLHISGSYNFRQFPYRDITALDLTEHYIIIVSLPNRLVCYVEKAQIRDGTPEELLNFLQSKMI